MGKEMLKALGREALRTGGMILTDIAKNPQAETQDIISRHVSDYTKNNKLCGGGARKRKRAMSSTRNAKRKRKTERALPRKGHQRSRTVKRDIFVIIYISHGTTMSQKDLAFVSSEFDIFAIKPVQHAVQEMNVVVYKPIASIE